MSAAQGNVVVFTFSRAEPAEIFLSVFTLKLRERSDNVILASILGGYSHIMWVRTENPENPVVKIFTTSDFEEETRLVLLELRKEIDFEFTDTEETP